MAHRYAIQVLGLLVLTLGAQVKQPPRVQVTQDVPLNRTYANLVVHVLSRPALNGPQQVHQIHATSLLHTVLHQFAQLQVNGLCQPQYVLLLLPLSVVLLLVLLKGTFAQIAKHAPVTT